MTLTELRNLFEKGRCTAFFAVAQSNTWSDTERQALYDEYERLCEEEQQKLHRLAHPSRYPAAYDRHEF
jgi:hypothetical protein